MSSDTRRRGKSVHRLGDDFDIAPGAEVPRLSDEIRRRLSINVTDIGGGTGFLVPLENLEVSTGFFEFVPNDKRPVLRFSGWLPKVTHDGSLSFGSTGSERRHMLERVDELQCMLALPAKVRELEEMEAPRVMEGEVSRLGAGIAQLERMQGRALGTEELTVFQSLPLDLSQALPIGLTAQRAEQVLTGLKARGWVTTDDHIVWTARAGCIWHKNALIGRRYCLYCLHEVGHRGREIETGRPRQTCPRCRRENPYIGQSLPRSFNYYAQEERLDTAHVTRTHRNSPLAKLADEHKHALLVDSEVFDLRLPRDVYAERAIADGSPIDPKGVQSIIFRWANGWVPLACRSPKAGMVTNVFQDKAGTALNVQIGEITVQFEPYWIPSVSVGTWVNVGDELAIPAERLELTKPSDYWNLAKELKRYLWTHVGEASWLVVEPELVNDEAIVLDRRRSTRISGRYRTLYPVVLLKAEHVGRVYVDTRDCRLGTAYAVDAGVLLKRHVGGVKLNLDALIGSCYDFFHCEQRWNEERTQGRKRGKKRRPVRSAKIKPVLPDMGAVTLPITGDELSDDADVVVLDPTSYVTPGDPSVTMGVLKDEYIDIGGTSDPTNSDAGTADGCRPDRVACGPEVVAGSDGHRAEAESSADGHQSERPADRLGSAGYANGETVLGPDFEAGCSAKGGSDLGNERQLLGVAEKLDPGV